MTVDITVKEYDVTRTLYSGQCFRFIELGPNNFRVFSGNKQCDIKQSMDKIEINTEDESYWEHYFGFDCGMLDLHDLEVKFPFLSEVFYHSQGLRLLNQDPWECLICFIISQQKQISQIKECVRRLCFECSMTRMQEGIYAFPTPQEILDHNIDSVKLGYRKKYVIAVADSINRGYIQLSSLHAGKASYHRAMTELCSLPGVGSKVANCVALFSLGHTEAFPIDVHIERMLALPELLVLILELWVIEQV